MTVLEVEALEAIIRIASGLDEQNKLIKEQTTVMSELLALLRKTAEEWEERA